MTTCSIREAAARLNVAPQIVLRMVQAGRILGQREDASVRKNPRWQIQVNDLERFAATYVPSGPRRKPRKAKATV